MCKISLIVYLTQTVLRTAELFASERKQIALMADEKPPAWISHRLFATSRSEMEINMSDKERVIELLDKVPDYKIGYILAYIQGITADEEADNKYCESLLQDYLNDKDPNKHDSISIEEFAQQEDVIL